jgi:hypothetical protein
MANEASNITTQRTIRDYISSKLENNNSSTGQNGVGLKITLSSALVEVYEVDLIWNGQEYLIAYKVSEDDSFPIIRKLNDVLPISFYNTTIEETNPTT